MPFGVDQKTAQAAQPAASETVSGIIELATAAEVAAGTDTSRAITPAGLAAGQIKFPAAQNASADANTLDDIIKMNELLDAARDQRLAHEAAIRSKKLQDDNALIALLMSS